MTQETIVPSVKLQRRTVIAALVSGLGPLISGCKTRFNPGAVSLYILNWSENVRSVSVEIMDGNRLVYKSSFTVDRNGSVYRDDIIDGGEYGVTVITDTGVSQNYAFSMGDCHDQQLTIRIREDELIELARDRC